MKNIAIYIGIAASGLLFAQSVFAHVSVNPKQAVPGYQTYSVRVPNEKDAVTTSVRLVVPEGVDIGGVMPVAGWTFTEKKEPIAGATPQMADDGDMVPAQRISEITWTGKLNPGEYIEFPISTQYAGDTKQLVWKAYQTYAGDGGIVAWDDTNPKQQAPKVEIVKALATDTLSARIDALEKAQAGNMSTPQWLPIGALLVAVAALVVGMKKRG